MRLVSKLVKPTAPIEPARVSPRRTRGVHVALLAVVVPVHLHQVQRVHAQTSLGQIQLLVHPVRGHVALLPPDAAHLREELYLVAPHKPLAQRLADDELARTVAARLGARVERRHAGGDERREILHRGSARRAVRRSERRDGRARAPAPLDDARGRRIRACASAATTRARPRGRSAAHGDLVEGKRRPGEHDAAGAGRLVVRRHAGREPGRGGEYGSTRDLSGRSARGLVRGGARDDSARRCALFRDGVRVATATRRERERERSRLRRQTSRGSSESDAVPGRCLCAWGEWHSRSLIVTLSFVAYVRLS